MLQLIPSSKIYFWRIETHSHSSSKIKPDSTTTFSPKYMDGEGDLLIPIWALRRGIDYTHERSNPPA